MTARSALTLLLILFSSILLFSSCGKKKAIQVGEFESYQDPIYNFGISYPKDWVKDPEPGKRIRIYSTFDARDRFLDPAASKQAGVYIEVGIDTTKGQTLESYAKAAKDRYAETSTVGEGQAMTLDGTPSVKIPFSMKLDSRNEIRGFRVATLKNNVVTYVEAAGFNQLLEDYKAVIDTSLSTVRFGRLMTAKAKEDISKPVDTFETYKGKLFDISYPSNFDFKFPQKPNTDVVMELKGYRQDCVVRIEVSDAKNLTVEKVLEQNKTNLQRAGYRIKNSGAATISGSKAQFVNLIYSKGEVDSRTYFTVKDNKLYFIFLTWYRPQTNVYVPTFEKMVASLKIK